MNWMNRILMMNHNAQLFKEMGSEFLSYLVQNDIKPGDRIPSLTELSSELNISISKLREQLEVARSLGLVEVRPRTGIRCADFDFMPALRMSLFFSLAVEPKAFEMYSSLRVHVETAYWHEAAALLTPEDITDLQALVAAAWKKLRGEHIIIPHHEHRSFHMGIFKRLENPFVRGILETYWEAYEAVELNRYADYSYLERVWSYHEKIAEELACGNVQAALEAYIEHTRLIRDLPRVQLSKNGH